MKYTVQIEFGYNLHKAGTLSLMDETGKVYLQDVAVTIPYKNSGVSQGKGATNFKAMKVTSFEHEFSDDQINELPSSYELKRYMKLYDDIAKRDELLLIKSTKNKNFVFAADNAKSDEALISDPDFLMMRKEDFAVLFSAVQTGELEVKLFPSMFYVKGEDAYVDLKNYTHSTRDKIHEMEFLKKSAALQFLEIKDVLIPFNQKTPHIDTHPHKLHEEQRPKLLKHSFLSQVTQAINKKSAYNDKVDFPMRKADAEEKERKKKEILEAREKAIKEKMASDPSLNYTAAAVSLGYLTSSNQIDPLSESHIYGVGNNLDQFRGASMGVDNNYTYMLSKLYPEQAKMMLPGSWYAQSNDASLFGSSGSSSKPLWTNGVENNQWGITNGGQPWDNPSYTNYEMDIEKPKKLKGNIVQRFGAIVKDKLGFGSIPVANALIKAKEDELLAKFAAQQEKQAQDENKPVAANWEFIKSAEINKSPEVAEQTPMKRPKP